MKPRLINQRVEEAPKNAVYIGRPSKYGNPFSRYAEDEKFRVKTRTEAIEKHKEMIQQSIIDNPEFLTNLRKELEGKTLVCWCKPKKCHGDILFELANPNIFDEW